MNDKVFIVCIAKNENNYIDEWINYHLNLGVDKIILIQDDWEYDLSKYGDKIITLKSTGHPQIPVYTKIALNLIQQKLCKYCMFIDVDEFFTFRKKFIGKTIYEILELYNNKYNFKSLILPWKIFGNNNLEKVENSNYSVIKRFTKCAKDFGTCVGDETNINQRNNNLYKSILNIHNINSYIQSNVHFWSYIDNIRQDGKIDNKPNFKDCINDDLIDIYFSHYYCKTKEELMNKPLDPVALDAFKNVDNRVKDRLNPLWNRNEIDNFDVLNIFNYYKN